MQCQDWFVLEHLVQSSYLKGFMAEMHGSLPIFVCLSCVLCKSSTSVFFRFDYLFVCCFLCFLLLFFVGFFLVLYFLLFFIWSIFSIHLIVFPLKVVFTVVIWNVPLINISLE